MTEADIIKDLDFEIDNIIRFCLGKTEMSATERMIAKQRLELKIHDLINKNERLIHKHKEQEKIIELMSNSIHQLVTQNDIAKYFQKRYCKAFYSEDISKCKDLICEECVKNYFIKKAKGD